MAGPEFFQTRMGQKFYQVDVPRLINALETIATKLPEKKTPQSPSYEELIDQAAEKFIQKNSALEVPKEVVKDKLFSTLLAILEGAFTSQVKGSEQDAE